MERWRYARTGPPGLSIVNYAVYDNGGVVLIDQSDSDTALVVALTVRSAPLVGKGSAFGRPTTRPLARCRCASRCVNADQVNAVAVHSVSLAIRGQDRRA
ncbi:hypothetical protein MARA_02850 (plasmid) [Mycolicibacterium arabiense]|uniref:Uncharacterized protein n=1 Tax=Mycolicibacterium arabiense TaxID=1286181 RepID=A0A7I7RSU7_9MYCO|nr:hypothetical protein MARA_02850 [Mycolicibacterium arabiense]